ncbi:ATP-binding cassette sub-family C member Sur isoform X2 [Cephus cinctus]|uniref:ATP-binding cassette sub-family C member Sur isoform X2 n=1 Tax=Cephus cinctus TaxID=211228 RepID=A0AAJ7BWP8_CEPCN|nr:ATP-binding cassette sub-family C member Sur isoform X2 [Cephus cinctus]
MGICEEVSSLSRLLVPPGRHLVWSWKSENGTTVRVSGTTNSDGDCIVELVNVFVAVLTFFVACVLSVKYRCTKTHKLTAVLLPLHNTRTLLCISLLLILLFELLESLLVPAAILPFLSILATISCWVVHRQTEVRDGLGVAISGGGFTIMAVARAWRLIYLHRFGLTIVYVRMFSTAAASCCCGLLAMIDSFTLYKMMRRSKRYTVRHIEHTHTSYQHDSSTLLSRLTFHWVVKLLARGYQAPLDLLDLGELPEAETTKVQFEKFRSIYEDEKKKCKNGKLSLWRCFWRRVWFSFTIGGILKLLGDATTLVGPMAISRIIDYISATQNSTVGHRNINYGNFVTIHQLIQNGYFLGVLIFLAVILQSTLSQASTHILNIEGIHLRTALQALVYDKALRLCSWSIIEEEKPPEKEKEKDVQRHQTADIGTLTNLMAEDAYNVMSFFWIGHYTWAVPLKIFAIIFLLYLKLGISAIVGAVCCILIVTPMQLYLGKKMSINSKSITERSDARLRLVNEVLQGMRLVKLRAWEDLFENRIRQTRNQELKLLDKDSFYWALITFLTHASSVLMTLFTFGVYFWVEERHLDAGNVFASLALFSQLTVPLFIFPVIVPIIINAMISTTRLEEFLLLPEAVNILPDEEVNDTGSIDNSKNNSIGSVAEANNTQGVLIFGSLDNIEEGEEDHHCHLNINDDLTHASSSDTVFEKDSDFKDFVVRMDGIFSWGCEDNQLIVNDLCFPRGKLTLVVGRIGSGKTSLLSAILGEISKVSGRVEWAKGTKVAYVAQKPWLLNATLRDNILFGSEYRPRRYRSVLRACALQPDVDILPGRDLTRIGEKGINLSGGQKQRITIARAIYSDADTIILDDPLSALDQQVGQQIFDHGIQRLLLRRGRSVIMVTHRLELMSAAEQIVAMEGCRLRAVGSRSWIEDHDPELAAEWKEAARRQDDQHRAHKTARDRWSLVRLISRIGITVRHRHTSDGSWSTDQDAHVTPPTFVPLRMRRSTLLGSRYLAHDLTDLPVPTEEWGIVRRRSKKHRNAVRATSLQPPKHPPPVLRQSSTPTILESHYIVPRKRYNTIDNGQHNSMLKQIFSGRSTPTQEWDHHPVKRLLSTESGIVDDVDDEDDKNSSSHHLNPGEDLREDTSGLVTSVVWLDYLKAGGIGPGLTYIAAALACQALRVYTDLWLSRWTDQGSMPNSFKRRHEDTVFYFKIYIALSVGSILLSALYNGVGQWAGARARRCLHQEAIAGLLKAPLFFFEHTPIGRILNRFSADMGVIDKKLSTSVQRLTAFMLLCGSAMLVNAIISPWFLIAALPTCMAYYFLQRFYRRSARELQRLDGSTRGPASAHFSETLAGLTTLRASKQQSRFMEDMVEHLDSNSNAFLILNTSSRWLGIALDYLGAVIVIAAIFTAIISAELYPSRVTPALVGLAVNYTLLVPIYLNWVVKFVSEIEMYMGSVARLSAYTKTPQENYRENGYSVSKEWPSKGEIIFESVSLRYDPQREPVIVNLNLHIPPGQKLGICGRTGSGKSSTAMSLLQLVEINQGRILLDGIDIRQVPLRTLRSRLSTIPQDVIMFSGTVRENLDPLCQHTDEELWSALELAQIKDIISSHPEGLNSEVREGGENFSAGQRQLLSMARAALRQSAVVILDEATSALDPTTEQSLLRAASLAFKSRTVITIAHRVASLLDCDRVIVFDEGKVVEDGPPKDLMRRPMGFFSAMLRASEDTKEKT